MRYLQRAHRVPVSWLYDVAQMKDMDLVFEDTTRMCADLHIYIYTFQSIY